MRVLVVFALAMLSFATASNADPIDFNSDPIGDKSEPFTSDDSAIVHFYDSVGDGLRVDNYGSSSNNSRALKVKSDIDFSALIMEFDLNMVHLSFDYGNDLEGQTQDGDWAFLLLYKDGNLVGMSMDLLNRNGLMDQTIGFTGNKFDTAVFFYGQFIEIHDFETIAAFTGPGDRFPYIGLAEVVDNINYRVPEPSLLALSGLGALVVAWRRRRKSA